MKRGFQRVKIDGKFYEIVDAPALDKKFKHDVDVVVDRVVVRGDLATRLADSLETALKLADGLAGGGIAEKGTGAERPARHDKTAKNLLPSEPHSHPYYDKIAPPSRG